MFTPSKVLCLSPHNDDIEFASGGLIARLTKTADVHIVYWADCTQSLPPGFTQDDLRQESINASSVLGVDQSNLIFKNYPVRKFNSQRQDILEELVMLSRLLCPDLVLIPSRNDLHQDHSVIHQEALRAFKRTTIISYEMVLNQYVQDPNLFVELSSEELEIKIKAANCYFSQSHRAISSEFLTLCAKFKGSTVGVASAEAFNICRMITRI